MRRRSRGWVEIAWGGMLSSSLTSCVTLGKLLNFSVPQFPHPEIIVAPGLESLWQGFDDIGACAGLM